MIYDVGDVATISTELRDANGDLINATVAITITKPDGTIYSPTPSVSTTGTGLYRASWSVADVGTWRYKWSASGAVTAIEGGQFDVEDAGRVLVAGLDEFKAQLDRTDSTDDAELRLYLEAATSQVEWLVGPLSPVTVTERYVAGGFISLRQTPVISVTSVAPVTYGAAGADIGVGDYYADVAGNGIVMHGYPYRGEFEVEYRAGRTAIPSDIKLAGLIIAQHLWAVQNARFTIESPGTDQMAMAPGSGFTIPYRALELLRPYMSTAAVGGIA